jgi:hypothetical protein
MAFWKYLALNSPNSAVNVDNTPTNWIRATFEGKWIEMGTAGIRYDLLVCNGDFEWKGQF